MKRISMAWLVNLLLLLVVLATSSFGAQTLVRLSDLGFLTTKGDLLTYSGSAHVRLPVGSNSLPLVGNSGATNGINWAALAMAGGGTDQTTNSNGDLLYGTGSAWSRLAAGTLGQELRTQGSAAPVWAGPFLNIWGDGSDGAVLMDGTNTFTNFATLSGSTYTLTRHVNATTIHLTTNTTLIPAGFIPLAQISITVDSGCTIQWNGANASGATGGAALTSQAVSGGLAGGTGTNSTSTPSQGASSTNVPAPVSGIGNTCQGGNGGKNTAPGGNNGQSSGGVSGPAANRGNWRQFPAPMVGYWQGITSNNIFPLNSGTGGGAGCGDGTNAGGGGGGAAGFIIIGAPSIVNNGSITATGGNGAAGVGGTAGGGGGGGGGVVFYNYTSFTGNTPTVGGGNFGAGAGSSAGNGSVGRSGIAIGFQW